MRLVVIAVGHRMPAWVADGFDEYAKRMPSEMRLELREVKPETRSTATSTDALLRAERARIEAVLPKGAMIVALDEHGRDFTTMKLAEQLERWRGQGGDVVFLIGGADGLAPELKARADLSLRISHFTLPHGLVRVILAEALYRAWTVTTGHPYHRA
ncbi:MAG TPA: 23S rRNA (pseudouridine(1915)-N(3))-methyltransferase RlmH [Burkholderiaceae bacterium]|nr:23S rRNA (pseudouridine(1915)-N(3))-methyltransferase RlmH [Burkholderiaceae bacterium]